MKIQLCKLRVNQNQALVVVHHHDLVAQNQAVDLSLDQLRVPPVNLLVAVLHPVHLRALLVLQTQLINPVLVQKVVKALNLVIFQIVVAVILIIVHPVKQILAIHLLLVMEVQKGLNPDHILQRIKMQLAIQSLHRIQMIKIKTAVRVLEAEPPLALHSGHLVVDIDHSTDHSTLDPFLV